MQKDIIRTTVQKLKALSSETRIKILVMLSHKSLGVCELTKALDLAQPTVTRHLKQLEDAGFVSWEREGNWIIYSLAPEAGLNSKLVRTIFEEICFDEQCLSLVRTVAGYDRAAICSTDCVKR